MKVISIPKTRLNSFVKMMQKDIKEHIEIFVTQQIPIHTFTLKEYKQTEKDLYSHVREELLKELIK